MNVSRLSPIKNLSTEKEKKNNKFPVGIDSKIQDVVLKKKRSAVEKKPSKENVFHIGKKTTGNAVIHQKKEKRKKESEDIFENLDDEISVSPSKKSKKDVIELNKSEAVISYSNKQIEKTDSKIRKILRKSGNKPPLIKDGDLFYGLSTPRLLFMEKFVPHTNETMNTVKNGKVKGGSRVAIIADTLNNQFLGTGYGYTALTNEEKIRKNKKSIEKEYEYKGIERDETEEIKRFRIFLETHRKYDPRKCPMQGEKLEEMSLRIGRACKGAIEYTVNKGNEVHFILDGINFDYIKDDLKITKAQRNITSKEIKWIYRNRNNKQVMENVNFYKDNKITKAPWDVDRTFWDIYDTYRKKKQKSKKK